MWYVGLALFSQRTVHTEQGLEMSRKLKAVKFVECSAKTVRSEAEHAVCAFYATFAHCRVWRRLLSSLSLLFAQGENLKVCFDEAVKSVLFAPKAKKKGCAIL